jgi:hypothetical protein
VASARAHGTRNDLRRFHLASWLREARALQPRSRARIRVRSVVARAPIRVSTNHQRLMPLSPSPHAKEHKSPPHRPSERERGAARTTVSRREGAGGGGEAAAKSGRERHAPLARAPTDPWGQVPLVILTLTAHLGNMKIRYTTDPTTAKPESQPRHAGPAGQLLPFARSFAREHAAGQVWWYRAPLTPVLAWFFWQHLQSFEYNSILGGLSLSEWNETRLRSITPLNDPILRSEGADTPLHLKAPMSGKASWRQARSSRS